MKKGGATGASVRARLPCPPSRSLCRNADPAESGVTEFTADDIWRRFDPRSAAPFVNKSVSEATRRAYGRALREFFQSAGMKHPTEVVPADVLLWRERLRSQKKSAATVAFKLSVVRSFFEYLKAAGAVPLNPALTKLVS